MRKTYAGSCHCGAVRFECELDLADGTSKCNYSICAKSRFWKAIAKAGAFRLLQGEDALSEYRFASNGIRHAFCGRCGVEPFRAGASGGARRHVLGRQRRLPGRRDARGAGVRTGHRPGRPKRQLWPAASRHQPSLEPLPEVNAMKLYYFESLNPRKACAVAK
jgi:hypothetical protein